MCQRKGKSTEKFSCAKEIKNTRQSVMRQKKERLLTICHASNSKFNQDILYIYIHNHETGKKRLEDNYL